MNKPDFLKGIGVVGALGLATLLGPTTAARAASLNSTDRQFLVNAAHTDMIESHEGKMAENQAAHANVKDLAKALVDDHNHSYERLTALASKEGVKIPRGINTAREREIAALAHLKGDQFDRVFSKDEVTDHQRALVAFRHESTSGRDPDVKAYATQMIPTLEKHLQLAKDCATKH